jgi:hypothetical protein
MSGGVVLWAGTPDEEPNAPAPETEAHGGVDETFAARRLRRWLKGMFGGTPRAAGPEDEPGRTPESER